MAISQIIATYAIIFTDYGFNLSATMEISINRHNRESLNIIFSNVLFVKSIIGLFCFFVFCLIILLVKSINHAEIYLVGLLQVVGQILFPIWFFQGIEQMGKITLFNLLSKLISTLCIFLFIHKSDQVIWAVFFYSLGLIVTGLVSFLYAINVYHISIIRPKVSAIKKYLHSGFDVFLPSFFSNIINNGGTLILGIFFPSSIVGIYSAIDRIIKAGIGLLSIVTQAVFPSIARKFSIDKRDAVNYIKGIAARIIIIITSSSVVLSLFSKRLLSIIYTPAYISYSYVFNWLLVWVIFGFLNNFIGIQFLVGSGNSSYYRKSFSITAIFVFFTYPLIKYFSIDGVIFSVLSGEVFLTSIMIYYIRQKRLLNG